MLINFSGFAKSKTMPVVYQDVISARDSGTLEQLKELSSKRKAIEQSLNSNRFVTEAIAREMSGGLTSRCEQEVQKLEHYLPLLENLVFHIKCDAQIRQIDCWISQLKIRWSSGLTTGLTFHFQGPKYYQVDHIYFELGMTLFLYGSLLRDQALEILSLDLVQSGTLFRRAAGVYDYLAREVLSAEFWNQKRPPEATSSVSLIMSLICLADAQAATATKAEKNGNSPTLLAKLHFGVKEYLVEAIKIWQVATEECKDISSHLLDFMVYSRTLHESMGCKYFAQALKHDGQMGTAIGVLRWSLANARDSIPFPKEEKWRLVYKQVIDETTSLLRKCEHENEFVWREMVPCYEDLPLPQAIKAVSAIPYEPQRWERTLIFRY